MLAGTNRVYDAVHNDLAVINVPLESALLPGRYHPLCDAPVARDWPNVLGHIDMSQIFIERDTVIADPLLNLGQVRLEVICISDLETEMG